MVDKKKRFGAPPPSSAVDIDAFINGSSTDSQEKIKHDKTVVVSSPQKDTPTAPAEQAPVSAVTDQAQPIVAPPAAVKSPAAEAENKPKRGRPAKTKAADADEPTDTESLESTKILFELDGITSEDFRIYIFEKRKSKAYVLREALKEYMKRHP